MTGPGGDRSVAITSPSRADGMEAVHEALDRLWTGLDSAGPASRDRLAFDIAVVEVASNIIRHSGSDHFDLELTVTPAEARATFGDGGKPLSVDLRALRCQADPMAEHGRGLHLAQASCHQLDYVREDGRNRWTIVRRLS